jgi:Rod binding domain-containing protein
MITGVSDMAVPAPAPKDPGDDEMARLRRAAEEFEAIMVGTLLKEMKFGAMTDGEGGIGTSTLNDYSAQVMSESLARDGGFGISEVLVRSMESHVRASAARQAEREAVE